MAAGDERALGELYDRHGSTVYALARAIVGERADTEEVVADAFGQAWRTAGQFDPARGSVTAWLATITRTRALDLVRARGRRSKVLASPADISFHADMLVQPDLFVLPITPDERRVLGWSQIRTLLLAVEVVSPSTARADRQVKRRLYQQERVGEYWIVDVDARIVERWRATDERPEIVSTSLSWHPEPSTAPFELDLPAFFDDVLRNR